MFSLVLLVLVAFATTAAWYDPFENNGYQESRDRFWDNFDRKLNDLNKRIEKVVKYSKNKQSSSEITGDEYKISIYLTGFNKEDIVVKATKGNLVIQAIHNVPGEPVNNYVEVRNLPDFVNGNGSWSYNNGKLTIVFPIKQRGSGEPTESPLPRKEKSGENNDSNEDELSEDLDSSDDTDNL